MNRSFYYRYRLGIIAIFLLATPLVIIRAQHALNDSSTRVADWLPESFEATQRLHWFQQHFYADDLLVVSWEGCTFDDPRLPALAEKLRQPVDVGEKSQLVICREIITGSEVLEQLRDEPLKLSRQAALRRLKGWLAGEDGDSTCMVLLMSAEGWQHRHFFIEHIYNCAAEIANLDRSSVHIGGSTADSVAVDHASGEGLTLMMILCYALGCVLMGFMFRSAIMTAIIFTAAIFCQQMSLAIIESTGGHMDSVMLMIPSLIYVLSISAGIHLANYYRDSLEEQHLDSAPSQAVRKAWLPCGLASLTTALGLGSLGVSSLTPIRNFGIYSAIGVLAATGVVFLIMPALLEQFPAPRLRDEKHVKSEKQSQRHVDRLMQGVMSWWQVIVVGSLICLGISLWGVTQIRASARIHDLFAPQQTILQDYDWLENRIGPLVPLEIVLRIPKLESEPKKIADQLRVVGAVHAAIENHPGVGAVVSALNFSPPIKRRGGGVREISQEAVLNKQLEQNREQFVEFGLLNIATEEELWRISARAYAKDGLNYSVLLEELQNDVSPLLQRSADLGMGKVSAVYCGGVPLVQNAQQQMIVDLIKSFEIAFAMITAMMIGLAMVGVGRDFKQSTSFRGKLILLSRRIVAGLISMIPNVLPCVVVLGVMGLLDVPLEIGSIMTASVALGIAVDDTLHFITWFRRGLDNGQSRVESIRYAYSRCATAMTQTSLVCGLGLLTFSYSSFVPISRFSWVMFAMLMAALVADLIVLPAILISPLGKAFERPSS